MPSKEEIDRQQQRLAAHRNRLAHYLSQRAQFGTAYEPPGVANGIAEARKDIDRCKAILRGWGEVVEDYPDDEDPTLPAHERSSSAILGAHPSSPPGSYHSPPDAAQRAGAPALRRIRKPPASLRAERTPKHASAAAAELSALPGAAPVPHDADQGEALSGDPPPRIDTQAPSVAAAWSAWILEQLEEALSQLEEKLKVLPYFWTTLDVEKPADEDIHIAVFFAGHRMATRTSIDKIRELEDELQSGNYLRRTILKSIRQHVTRIRERNSALDAALTIVSNYSNSIATALAVREAQASAKELIETLLRDFDETAVLLRLGFVVIALEGLERELKIVCDDLTDAISKATGRPIDIQVKMIAPEPLKARLS